MSRIGVYILQCSNSRYYTGSSDDVERRFVEHEKGKSKATKNLLPVELKAFIECNSLSDARTLEYQIKQQKSKKYLEKLIEENPQSAPIESRGGRPAELREALSSAREKS